MMNMMFFGMLDGLIIKPQTFNLIALA